MAPCVQVHVDNLSDKQVANQVEVRGPPASKAFDQQGKPTKVSASGIYHFYLSTEYKICSFNRLDAHKWKVFWLEL